LSLAVRISDGRGTKNIAEVHSDGALGVIVHPEPPLITQKVQPFRQYMTDDGLATGSNDMGIDGSVTDADFWVSADNTKDRYITNLSIEVAYAASGKPYLFADGAALINGCRLFYNSVRGEVDIHDAITANQEFFRLFFSLIPTAWEVRHVNANNDYGYFLSVNLKEMMPPFGIKLDRESAQRLTMRIRDDASAAVTFNVVAYGFDRFDGE
jgi:hypothetical protein